MKRRTTYSILFGCMGVMVLYCVAQDLITVRLSREYFTVAHDPRDVPFDDPTLMALGWGFRAGVGPGAILGVVLALVSTVGPKPPLRLRDLLPGLGVTFALMAWTTSIAGLAGWWVADVGDVRLGGSWGVAIPATNQARFVAVACAHLAAYASGIVGSVGLSVWAGRLRSLRASSRSPA